LVIQYDERLDNNCPVRGNVNETSGSALYHFIQY
jgi:hypothetical protein